MSRLLLLTVCLFTLPLFLVAQTLPTLLDHWSDSTLVASNVHFNTYNEVWGHVHDGREYGIVGSTKGTHIFDVTEPESIELIQTIDGGSQGGVIIHRDYHTYRDYLYGVADEGGRSTLQVIDLSSLPDSASLVYDSNEHIRRSHNIFIDTTHARLYSLLSGKVGQSGFDAMAIFDISDPVLPVEIGRYNDIGGFAINHVHDAYVEDHLAFLNCGFDGFVIADMTDVDTPQLLAAYTTADYPQGGYNHSGWPTEDGNYYYMADENHGFDLKIFDVSDLQETRFLSTFNAGSPEPFAIPHNQIVSGDKLYVSYYFDGLQVFDISDPVAPVLDWSYDTSSEPHRNGVYRGAWGVYPFLPSGIILVSDMQEGLFVIQPPQPTATTIPSDRHTTMQVYPNPAVDRLTISGDHTGGTTATITNTAGQSVASWPLGEQVTQVHLPTGIAPGQYILTVRDAAITRSVMVTVMR